MINQLNKMIDYFIDNIYKDIVILTDYEHFLLFDDKEKGLDMELQLNTYKGHLVILRDDMPLNNHFVIMTKEDYIRNTNNLEKEVE